MKSGTTPFNIKVPDGDPNFGDGAVIGVNRVEMAQGTGTDAQHPRRSRSMTPADVSFACGRSRTRAIPPD
jgi:hypothetical protein